MLLIGAVLVSTTFGITCTWAIVEGHVDDFNDGTTQGWGVGMPGVFPVSQPDLGQSGAGDYALWMANFEAGGSVPNLLVINESTNWTGDWIAAGVTRIAFDVQGPGSNSFPLAIRLGIVASGSPFGGGSGDTYITDAIDVPSDGQWHRVTFDVLPSNFIALGDDDIEDALTEVAHFRILHNPLTSFTGASPPGGAEFFLDNIQALSSVEPEPPTGDYNQNGVVDAADYVIWRSTLGDSVANEGDGADGDRSGEVDSGDYNYWRERFGNVDTQPARAAAVPEPTAVALILSGLAAFMACRPRAY
jgi:hypothetical protein